MIDVTEFQLKKKLSLQFVIILLSLTSLAHSQPEVSIVFPEDSTTYDTTILDAIAIVEDQIPESTYYSLNGGGYVLMDRVNTDWPTYGQNSFHTGFSESPAPRENVVLWTADVTGAWDEFTGPVVVDGIVYIASKGYQKTFALNAVTGDTIWEYPTGRVDGIIAVANGKVFVNSYTTEKTWCLDAKTGDFIWSFSGMSGMMGTPAIWDGKVYVSDYYGVNIYILDEATGGLIQSKQIPSADYTTSAPTVWDGKVYISYRIDNSFNPNAPTLRCFDALDIDHEIWNNDTLGGPGYHDTSPTIHDSILFIGGLKGEIQAYDALTGTLKWTFNTVSVGVISTPAVHNGMVFAGDINGKMWAVSESTGTYIWDFKTEGGKEIYSSPAIADGMVFFGGLNNKMYGVDELTGQKIWEYDVGDDIFSSAAVTDGVVYISTDTWLFYAFGSLRYKYNKSLTAIEGENQLIVYAVDSLSLVSADTVVFFVTIHGIETEISPLPKVFSLSQNFPNPFSKVTSIRYQVANKGEVSLKIYDLMGRLVKTLVQRNRNAGYYTVNWNGKDKSGKKVANGIYFYRFYASDCTTTKKMFLVR